MNNLLMILEACDEYRTILGIVKGAIRLICYAVPVIIIVLTVIDVAKVATAGNADDKMKKEVGQKVVTRLIYAVVIFLVPVVIGLVFKMLEGKSNEVKNNTGGDGGECTESIISIYNSIP